MAYTTEVSNPTSTTPGFAHWSARATDPNDPSVVHDRAKVLASAWRDPVASRADFIRQRVTGRNVLDVGCVAHDDERMRSSQWLHRQIAEAAESCVGIDVLHDGVAAMNAKGYNAVVHNLDDGLGPIAGLGPFQVIVAGELIEHVGNLDMLFSTAAQALTADGEIILTSPNPYAPRRVRAGQRGDVWENADHVSYAFPSGIAELASRHGLILSEAMTTEGTSPAITNPIRWMKRTIKRSHWHRRGFATTAGNVRPIVLDRWDRIDRLRHRLSGRVSSNHRFVGETFIYVVQRGPLP